MVDLASKTAGLTLEEAIESCAQIFYANLDQTLQKAIEFEDFKNKVREYTEEKDPPKVLKDLNIEPWLEPIWRNNEKINWDHYKWLLIEEGKENIVKNK